MQFSPAQQAAIDARNAELLVSAAAGSGKTAVLIEKIYTLLKADGLSIDRMLVVTFTRAAAAEMRERLKQRMAGDADAHIRRQRDRLELAHISTLHSFCHSLTQEYFHVADIDPLSAIADATTASNLFQEATDEAMERLYARAETDAAAAALTAKFEDKQIVSMLGELYPFLMTLSAPFGWLAACAAKRYTPADLQTGPMADTLLNDCALLLDGARELADELQTLCEHPQCHEKYRPAMQADREAVRTLLASVQGGLLPTVRAAQAFALDRMPGVRGLSDEEKEINLRYKEIRDGLKALAAKVGALFTQPPETILARLNAMQPALTGLSDLCADLHQTYLDKKKQRSVLDPSDLEHMALQILSHPEIRAAVAARFDAVFVDEYQDISGVQEALLNAIKGRGAPGQLESSGQSANSPILQSAPIVSRETGRGAPGQLESSGQSANSPVLQSAPIVSRETGRGAPGQLESSGQSANSPILQSAPIVSRETGRGAPGQLESSGQSANSPILQSASIVSRETEGAVSGHTVTQRFFYVGDVKQSIYRFRQADPTLFMHKEETFSDGETAPQRRIDLNLNYRSRGAVLDAVNRVFSQIMRKDATEITYDGRARLYAGQETENDPPVQLHLFTEPLKSADRTRVQAAALAEEINKRVGEPFFDRKESRMRTLRYRDIAILAPTMKGVDEVLTRVLGAAHIPVYAEGSGAGLGSDEIAQVLCHLRLMDNIQDDLSLLACLRSPAMGFTDAELSEIRIRTPKGSYLQALRTAAEGDDTLSARCAHALSELEHERFLLRNMPLPEYLWKWLSRSGLYAFYGCQPYGRLRQANLRLLCEKAVEFQSRGGGDLHAFLQSVVSATAVRESVSPTVLSPREDVVRVMSIHKSKGLEFPVVFLMGLEASFTHSGGSAPSLHQRLGIALPYIDEVRRVKGTTLLANAISLRQKAENLAERARVLYVGMTRARDELILMGCMNTPRFTADPPSAYAVSNAGNMLDWLVACADPGLDTLTATEPAFSTQSTSFPHKTGGFWIVSHNSASETMDLLRNTQPSSGSDSLDAQRARLEKLTEEARALAQTLPPAAPGADPLAPPIRREHRPFKVGVTALVRARRLPGKETPALVDADTDDPGDAETVRVKRLPLPLTRPRQIADLPALPAFMRETGAVHGGLQRGVATHKALCLLRYAPLRALLTQPRTLQTEIQAQLDGFLQKRLFTREEISLIDPGALAGFFQSPWGRDALLSKTVKREWGFVLRLPEEDGMLVQGVIDLCYIKEGQWELVDYKTDAVASAGGLWSLYEAQTALYRRALEEVTGIPVRGVTLYALSLGEGSRKPAGFSPSAAHS